MALFKIMGKSGVIVGNKDNIRYPLCIKGIRPGVCEKPAIS